MGKYQFTFPLPLALRRNREEAEFQKKLPKEIVDKLVASRNASGPRAGESNGKPGLLSSLLHFATTIESTAKMGRTDDEDHGLFAGHRALVKKLRVHQRELLREQQIKLTAVQIPSTDQVVLSGTLLQHSSGTDKRPLMVMVPPTGESSEALLALAGQYVKRYGCDVLLYDSRGINGSTGSERKIDDAVADCEAALHYAAQISDRLAVWGFSLGGGICAQALKNVKNVPAIHDKIDLFVNYRSFSSLSRATGSMARIMGYRGTRAIMGSFARHFSRGVMKLTNYNNLNSAKVIAKGGLAQTTLVYAGEEDTEMRYADVESAIRKKRSGHTPDDTTFLAGPGGHDMVDLADESEEYQDMLSSWALGTGLLKTV